MQARQDHGKTPSPALVQLRLEGIFTVSVGGARTEDAEAESDSSNATLCNNCSRALQKPLVCARCKTATYCSKDCQVLKTVID